MTSLLLILVSALPTESVLALDPVPYDPLAPLVALGPIKYEPLAPVPAPVEDTPELEYTYVEANYVFTDSDLIDDNLNGWSLTGSFELPLNFFVQGTILEQNGDADLTAYKVGVGWHFGFTSRLDAYGIAGYQGIEVSDSSNDFDDDGVSGEVGLRALITQGFEVNGRLLWADIEENNTSIGVGARYYFTPSLSAGVNYDVVENDDQVTAGLRFEFL